MKLGAICFPVLQSTNSCGVWPRRKRRTRSTVKLVQAARNDRRFPGIAPPTNVLPWPSSLQSQCNTTIVLSAAIAEKGQSLLGRRVR
jgi:hypothetical protein